MKLEGWEEGKRKGEGILGKGARSCASKLSGLPFLLVLLAKGLYSDLPKEPQPVPASAELEWPLIGMEAVWVSNALGFLFCFVFWPQNPFFNRNLAWQTNVENTELPLDD